ncbi:hypothetical protein D3C71_1784540 [compost metagenome]
MFLQAQLGVSFAIRKLGVATWPFVDLVLVMLMPRRVLAHVGEVGLGLLEIVIVVVMPAGLHFLQQLPCVEVFFVSNGGLSGRMKRNDVTAGQWAV